MLLRHESFSQLNVGAGKMNDQSRSAAAAADEVALYLSLFCSVSPRSVELELVDEDGVDWIFAGWLSAS